MQKQTNPEPLGAPTAKLVLVAAIIAFLGAALGVAVWVITKPKITPPISELPFNLLTRIRHINFIQVCSEKNDFKEFCDDYQIAGANNPITYKELTGDGKEEAIIPLGSGGSSGNIGIAVFQYKNDKLSQLLLSRDNDFKVENNQLITIKQELLNPQESNQRSDVQYTYYVYNKENNRLEIEEAEPVFDTSDWKTYRNDEYGFEMKYPENWSKSEEIILSTRKEIQFYEDKNIIVSVMVGAPYSQNLGRNFTLEEWIAENKNAIGKYNEVKEEKIILDNIEASEISYDGMGTFFREIYFQQEETMYEIEISYLSERTEKNTYKSLSDQILSTFKFIEKNE